MPDTRKDVTVEIGMHDLTCLTWCMQNFPKTTSASEAMTIGSASMLVDSINEAFNKAKPTKKFAKK